MKILYSFVIMCVLYDTVHSKLSEQNVKTIKSFLRNLVSVSLKNFEQKLAVEMREREQQNLQQKKNRKLFFGFFRHKKKKQKKQKKKIQAMESQMFSKTVIKGGKTKEQSQVEQLYDHMQEEFKIELVLDQMVDEGYGEKLLYMLEQKMKKVKRHRYHKKTFPQNFQDFSSHPMKHKHHHRSNKIKVEQEVDPLFEIYKDIPLDKTVLDVQSGEQKKKEGNGKDDMKELDDFLNNYYLNVNASTQGQKTFSAVKEIDPMKSVWGLNKKM